MSAVAPSNTPNPTEQVAGAPLSLSHPDLRKFIFFQHQALDDCLRRIRSQETVKSKYETLKTRLATIADRTRHSSVVQLGPHALVRGELIHTNEILVFLGDSYFVERTSKQAESIAARRIAKLEENLANLNEERNLLESRLRMMADLSTMEDNVVEIHEPISDDESPFDRTTSDEHIRRRLDELEAEEEMQEESDESFQKHLVPPVSARPRRSSLPSQGDHEKKQRKSVSFAPFDGPVPVSRDFPF